MVKGIPESTLIAATATECRYGKFLGDGEADFSVLETVWKLHEKKSKVITGFSHD